MYMLILSEVFEQFSQVVKELFSAIWKSIPFIFELALWFICAFVVMPAVFIANSWYPKWQKWGEKF